MMAWQLSATLCQRESTTDLLSPAPKGPECSGAFHPFGYLTHVYKYPGCSEPFSLEIAENFMSDNQRTHTHKSPSSKEAGRESHYSPCILWFTGLSAAGKTVAARAVSQRLAARTCPVHWLDGDVVRRTQSKDLGFTMRIDTQTSSGLRTRT